MLARTLLVVSLMGFVSAPAAAGAASRDIASTHAYIRANYAYLRASKARIASAEANVRRVIGQFAQQCPKVGAGSPQDEAAQRLTYEVAGALWSASYSADVGPIRAFVRAVGHLQWSNRKLTQIARRYIKSLGEFIRLPIPDLCGDVHTWATSGFRTVSQSTINFDRHVEEIEGHTIPPHLLAPFANAADRRTLSATQRLEVDLQNAETSLGFNDWNALLETLGLNQ